MKRKSPTYRHIIELVIAIAALVVINLISEFKFFRIDLTEDKIHTLNPQTEAYLENEVDDVINIVVYLHGKDLPPIIQKFKQSIKDKLDEFKAYAGSNIKYSFVDINEDPTLTKKYKQTFQQNFVQGNMIQQMEDGSAKIVEFFPIVEVRHQSYTKFIDFMGDITNVSPYYVEQRMNYIEYEFLAAFHHVSGKPKPTVSLLRGHGELSNLETISIYNQLKNFYVLDTARIIVKKDSASPFKEDIHALDKTDVLIVAKPIDPFTDKELFILDQYIMNGGKVIWSIDMLEDHEDSLMLPGQFTTNTAPNDKFDNLEKMLYKYGAGIKKNFISNKICAPQLRYDGRDNSYWNAYYFDNYNNKKLIERVIPQWYPFACVTMENSELIRNIGRVKLKYPSTININEGAPSKKTVILETDYEHKQWPAITRIRYDERNVWDDLNNIDPAGKFYEPIYDPTKPPTKQPLAVMLEGEFNTHYNKNLLSPAFLEGMSDANFKYKEKSSTTSMMIIGDGDFLRSDVLVTQKGKQPINIGLDYLQSNEMIYGNATFLHNCIDKMTGSEYLIPLRSRIQPPRFLNTDEIYYNRGKWEMINLIVPSIFVLLLAGAQWFIRRKRYIQ